MYKIKQYSYDQAKKLNVIIKPSNYKNKKIDVYTADGKYICSIGDYRYLDYAYYYDIYGPEIANQHRRLYKLRHKNDRLYGKVGYWSDKILW